MNALQRRMFELIQGIRKGGKITLIQRCWPSREERRARLIAALRYKMPYGSKIEVATAGGKEDKDVPIP